MKPQEVIDLFDSIWFQNKIFQTQRWNLKTNPDQKSTENDPGSEKSKLPTIHVRSKSDQLSSSTSFCDSLSPNSILFTPRLQTILSGKEAKDEESETEMGRKTEQKKEGTMTERKIRTKGSTRSLSDLEFEELKGFMDLGFVFSEKDVDSSLVEVIPGLQRLGKREDEVERGSVSFDEVSVQRPYLSEAWKCAGRREKINPLMNWEIPDLGNEIDVKLSLKCWAHSVASTVR